MHQTASKHTLRQGYTTGSCATAASKAALQALLTQTKPDTINIYLPDWTLVSFNIVQCKYFSTYAFASVKKDAGDDPDVTHGLTITSTVSFNADKEIHFKAGRGVGKVTLEGLEIPKGEPAINPVPRRMITYEINRILEEHRKDRGVDVSISVSQGEEIAKKTLNSRLGIENGISIIGTSGMVKPYSSESFIASIHQNISVAVHNGCKALVLNSGAKSERILKNHFRNLPDFAFIQYGNWIGDTLERINQSPVNEVYIGIMPGKAVKLAEGHLNTHNSKVRFNPCFLRDVALDAGYDHAVADRLLSINVAREITGIFPFTMKEPFYHTLSNYCRQTCKQLIQAQQLHILLIDLEGNILEYETSM